MHRVECNMLKRPGTASKVSVEVTHCNRSRMSASKLSRLLWSDAAVCCYLLVVALLLPAQGLCTTGTGQGMSDRVNTQKTHAYVHYSMLCNSGQLQLSAGCSEYCRMHRACTGFVQHGHTNTGCKACLTASTHANRHAHLYSSSAALTVQLRLFAIYSGYCRMGFVQHA
jgi:hypothetical protein